ncbi:hypothetical protein L6452_20558 [Arctium lappa]|uniref:Uncharacterized protein n=1 Tax=Arctium lappa TaxID=4217 RepID=A0ACB9BD01_ARCLA|nr:hypothetical protein L6452_20558 [Arctium lappa]
MGILSKEGYIYIIITLVFLFPPVTDLLLPQLLFISPFATPLLPQIDNNLLDNSLNFCSFFTLLIRFSFFSYGFCSHGIGLFSIDFVLTGLRNSGFFISKV